MMREGREDGGKVRNKESYKYLILKGENKFGRWGRKELGYYCAL